MLECCRKITQLSSPEADFGTERNLFPLPDGLMDLSQNLARLLLIQGEPGSTGHQHVDVGDGAVFFGKPGF